MLGLQFTAMQCRSQRTCQAGWSRLNRSGPPRPELLMRLGIRLLVTCRGCISDLMAESGHDPDFRLLRCGSSETTVSAAPICI